MFCSEADYLCKITRCLQLKEWSQGYGKATIWSGSPKGLLRWTWRTKSNIDTTAEMAMQQRTVECEERDRAQKMSHLSTASGEVSRRNGSPCHWIKISSAEKVGLPLCNSNTTENNFTHRFCCVIADPCKSCGDR